MSDLDLFILGNVFHDDEQACYRGCTADGAKVNVLHGCGGPSDVKLGNRITINHQDATPEIVQTLKDLLRQGVGGGSGGGR